MSTMEKELLFAQELACAEGHPDVLVLDDRCLDAVEACMATQLVQA